MRKKYEKPMLFRETFQLDASIALGCDSANNQLMNNIKNLWENGLEGSSFDSLQEFAKWYLDNENKKNPSNQYCYQTASNPVFTS